MIAAVAAAAFFSEQSRPSEQTGFLMDTQVRLVIYDRGAQKETLEGAFALIRNIDQMMNVHNEQSELSLLNREGRRMVSPELFSVIQRGLYFSELSDGLFDITVRPLTEIWDFKQERVPQESEIAEAMQKVNYRNVFLRTDHTVVLSGGAQLDLGGIAKGYAADCVSEYLQMQGVKNALIDIGGNIKAIGDGEKGNGFQIGLQNPNGNRGNYFAVLPIRNASVVSSGVYERNFEKDGQLYHHIIDPRTGWPLKNGMVAASVITESSMDADALSTTLMLMGGEAGKQFAQKLSGVECVLVDEQKNLFLSDGLKHQINITDSTYHEKEGGD